MIALDTCCKLLKTKGGYCMPDEGPTFLTVNDISKDLQVSDQTVWRWIKSGKLIAHKFGGEYRISKADYKTFLDNHRKKQPS